MSFSFGRPRFLGNFPLLLAVLESFLVFFPHLLDFRWLHLLQSTWQFSITVRPPSSQDVM